MTESPKKTTRELIFEGLELVNAASSPEDFSPASAVRAFELFRGAAERGSCAADFMLGVCFDFGRGVAVDKEAAYRHYESAAAGGLAEARIISAFAKFSAKGRRKTSSAARRAF